VAPRNPHASKAHHAALAPSAGARLAKAAKQLALPEPLLSTRAFPISPKYTRAKIQGQGALSYFVVAAHLPASPKPLLSALHPATLAHRCPPPADWPGESWHSTLLLAPSKRALTSTVRQSVGLPAMVGIFRRLYDWLLSLFWYVLTVIVSSFSCRLMCHVLDAVGCRLKLMMVATWHLGRTASARRPANWMASVMSSLMLMRLPR
jgi:hypothetical protein